MRVEAGDPKKRGFEVTKVLLDNVEIPLTKCFALDTVEGWVGVYEQTINGQTLKDNEGKPLQVKKYGKVEFESRPYKPPKPVRGVEQALHVRLDKPSAEGIVSELHKPRP